jgi:hypothetical protein
MQLNLYLEVTVGTMKECTFKKGDLFKRGSNHMKFSITGQEKGDLLIQVTA